MQKQKYPELKHDNRSRKPLAPLPPVATHYKSLIASLTEPKFCATLEKIEDNRRLVICGCSVLANKVLVNLFKLSEYAANPDVGPALIFTWIDTLLLNERSKFPEDLELDRERCRYALNVVTRLAIGQPRESSQPIEGMVPKHLFEDASDQLVRGNVICTSANIWQSLESLYLPPQDDDEEVTLRGEAYIRIAKSVRRARPQSKIQLILVNNLREERIYNYVKQHASDIGNFDVILLPGEPPRDKRQRVQSQHQYQAIIPVARREPSINRSWSTTLLAAPGEQPPNQKKSMLTVDTNSLCNTVLDALCKDFFPAKAAVLAQKVVKELKEKPEQSLPNYYWNTWVLTHDKAQPDPCWPLEAGLKFKALNDRTSGLTPSDQPPRNLESDAEIRLQLVNFEKKEGLDSSIMITRDGGMAAALLHLNRPVIYCTEEPHNTWGWSNVPANAKDTEEEVRRSLQGLYRAATAKYGASRLHDALKASTLPFTEEDFPRLTVTPAKKSRQASNQASPKTAPTPQPPEASAPSGPSRGATAIASSVQTVSAQPCAASQSAGPHPSQAPASNAYRPTTAAAPGVQASHQSTASFSSDPLLRPQVNRDFGGASYSPSLRPPAKPDVTSYAWVRPGAPRVPESYIGVAASTTTTAQPTREGTASSSSGPLLRPQANRDFGGATSSSGPSLQSSANRNDTWSSSSDPLLQQDIHPKVALSQGRRPLDPRAPPFQPRGGTTAPASATTTNSLTHAQLASRPIQPGQANGQALQASGTSHNGCPPRPPPKWPWAALPN